MTRPRPATPTAEHVDRYCALYRDLFANVRHFEQFTALHLGLLAQTQRKSLPQIARVTGTDPQALHHFLSSTSWSVERLRARRLDLLRRALDGAPFILCIEDTGNAKKGTSTDYVARQYIGNLHTTTNGLVSVDAYGILGTATFPLLSRIYKPEARLAPGELYQTKPRIAFDLLGEISARGFASRIVLTDSFYGQSGQFIAALRQAGLGYALTMRSNVGGWMLPGQQTRATRWRRFDPQSSKATGERRYLRELVFGARRMVRCYEIAPEIAPDGEHVPTETTWRLMTDRPGKVEEVVGSATELKTAIEYGYKHAKDMLGWADFRLMDAASIERWWEIVMSAHLLVSLHSPPFSTYASSPNSPASTHPPTSRSAAQRDLAWAEQLDRVRLLLTR
ncbi:MAG TPA: IS701 family transposase [Ktedonobacterales bacterium]